MVRHIVRRLWVLMTLLPGACAVPPEGGTPPPYFPMAVGRSLIYQVHDIDEKDRLTVSESRYTCVGVEKVRGVDCFVVDQYANNRYSFTASWACDREGLKLYRWVNEGSDNILDPPDIYLKLPFVPGESWEWEGTMLNKKQKSTHRSEAIETVVVPAGRFDCFKIRDEIMVMVDGAWVKTFWGHHWYSRDVGLVKVDMGLLHPSGDRYRAVVELKAIREATGEIVVGVDPLAGRYTKDPLIGTAAPAVTLQDTEGAFFSLEALREKKPALIMLSSYTSAHLRSTAHNVRALYENFRNDVVFLWVYTREAFPASPGQGPPVSPSIPEHRSMADRTAAARSARAGLKLNMPLLMDDMKNSVLSALGGDQDTLVLLDEKGRILARDREFSLLNAGQWNGMLKHVVRGDVGYYPMEVGCRWEYTTNQNDQKEFSLSIAEREKTEGVDWVLRKKIVEEETVLIDFMAHEEDGLKFFKEYNSWGKDTFDSPQTIIRYPVRAGDSWTWEGKAGEMVLKRSFVHEGEEVISVPAGTFLCTRVAIRSEAGDGTRVEEQRWFARGVGLVREVAYIFEKKRENFFVSDLKSFRIP